MEREQNCQDLINTDTIDESLLDLFELRSDEDIRTIEDFYAIVHPDDRSRVRAAFEATRTSGVHLDTEFRVVWADTALSDG